MKRLIISVFTALLCLMLCGCSTPVGTQNDRRFMVTALGFSGNDDITLTAEIVTVNSESAESEPYTQVLTYTANSINEALNGIADSLSRPMLLEHCGVIVIDTALSAESFAEICDYCFKENKITLSVYMVAAENPKTLLDGEPLYSVAVGYDIMGIIGQKSETEKMNFTNRYFEIESGREKGETAFSLPYFRRGEDGVSLVGTAVFENDKFTHMSEEPK